MDRFVPVANAHAGWVARDLAERVPGRVAGVALINWLVLGAPPLFTAGLAALADPATTRAAADGLTASWLAGHEDLPGIAGQIAVMRQQSDEMWARAGREIAAAYAIHTSPLQAFAALPAAPPVRHLYAEPKDPAFLAAQQDFALAHPWFSVRRLDTAHTHFPMLEQPADLAGDLIRFADSLGRTSLVCTCPRRRARGLTVGPPPHIAIPPNPRPPAKPDAGGLGVPEHPWALCPHHVVIRHPRWVMCGAGPWGTIES